MSTFGHYRSWGTKPEYTIDMMTRKIKFKYSISEDYSFEFDLLSECRDDVQKELQEMLEEDGIVLGILDTESEYCNVVMFADLPWEDENGDIM
jgi:hypothetical protein